MPDKEASQVQSLVVALRVRPINATELNVLGSSEIIHCLDENLVVLRDPNEDTDDILRVNRSREKQYVFDHAFGPTASQVEVFSKTTKPLIDGVVSGYNATVFAYGATGAGKTYTMLGTDSEIGIMGLTLNNLFSQMDETNDDMAYKVTMSYLEIYNEMIRDLLNPSSGYLELREDGKGVNVAGISEVEAKTTSEVLGMLHMGNKQRTSEPTAANKTSSRSHAILQVTVTQESRVKNIIREMRVGKLFMIDLAGSERAAQTKNRGKRMIEGAHINRSLLALGNCINALSENRGHYVNYRDSKLTRLLKDSLGGNCHTVMIAHVSPASRMFEESRNTLLYADRAKSIKTKVKRNQFNVSYHIAQYTNIIADLRKEIFRLKTKIADQDINELTEGKAASKRKSSRRKDKDHAEMTKLRSELVSTFREQMEIRRKLMDLEDTAMQIALDTNRYMLTIDEWDQEKARRSVKNAALQREKQERLGLESSSGDTTGSPDSLASSSPLDKNGKAVWIKGNAGKNGWNGDSNNGIEEDGSLEDVEIKDIGNEKSTERQPMNSEPLLNGDEFHSTAEPEEVTFAREEINNLITEEKRVSELKAGLQAQLQETRQEVERLEELLPQKISSEENREILGLICKVHELEISNAELQSQSLLRENLLRYKDLEVSKHESRQRLCDEIIRLQRHVITDAQINCPAELDSLFEVYMQQMDADDRENLGREGTQTSLSGSTVSLNKAAVLAGINRRMISRENLFTFSSKLSPLTEETPSRLVSLQNSPVKMMRSTLSAQTLAENPIPESTDTTRALAPPPSPRPRPQSRTSSPDDVSLTLQSPTPPLTDTKSPRTPEKPAPLPTRPQTPIFSKTQKIADIAARRRMIMDKGVSSSRASLVTNEEAPPSKASSLTSVRESRDRDRPIASNSDSNVVASRKATNDVKASLSLGDLSVIDKRSVDGGSVESVPLTTRRKRVTKNNHVIDRAKHYTPTRSHKRLRSASLDETKPIRVMPRRTRKEELQEAVRRGTGQYQTSHGRAMSLEGRNPAPRRVKRSRVPKPPPVQPTELHQGLGRGRDSTKQRDSDIEGDLLSFTSNPTPPATVHQYNTHGKELTIQRRQRVPSELAGSDSNQSTPRLKPRRAQPQNTGNATINELTISGFAVRPSKQFAGVRKF